MKKIYILLRGRLGNQLFIYAFAKSLKQTGNYEVILIDNINDTTGNSLINFNIDPEIKIIENSAGAIMDYKNMTAADYSEKRELIIDKLKENISQEQMLYKLGVAKMTCKQKLYFLSYKLFIRLNTKKKRYEYEKNFLRKGESVGIYFCENGYLPIPNFQTNNSFCYGYFQSEKYFSDIKSVLLKELKTNQKPIKSNNEFVSKIESTNSVCVSIRLGDAVNNPVIGVCKAEYFQKAIDYMQENLDNPTFFIFSDQEKKVRKMFDFKSEIYFEPFGNPDYEKVRYMSKCKHYILSNSSFSWWVQYLSENESKDKVVIAPSRWYLDDTPCDIYQKHWKLIKC